MSINSSSEFPRVAENPHMMRAENLTNALEEGFSPRDINSVVSSILEAPMVLDEEVHDLMWAEGYIHPSPLRQNFPSAFWDLEDGEVLEVYLIESLESDPEVYEGKLNVRNELPLDASPDMGAYEGTKFTATPQEIYGNGGIVISGYPEDMNIKGPLSHNFRVIERPEKENYEGVEQKLMELFGGEDYQSTKAMRGLNMDYDEFKQGRLF